MKREIIHNNFLFVLRNKILYKGTTDRKSPSCIRRNINFFKALTSDFKTTRSLTIIETCLPIVNIDDCDQNLH